MRIFKKALLTSLLLVNYGYSYCVPVVCVPEGKSGEMQVVANISGVDSSIKEKYNKIKELNNKEKELLKTILEKQKEYIDLTSSKEVYFMKIIDNSSTLSLLLRNQK